MVYTPVFPVDVFAVTVIPAVDAEKTAVKFASSRPDKFTVATAVEVTVLKSTALSPTTVSDVMSAAPRPVFKNVPVH